MRNLILGFCLLLVACGANPTATALPANQSAQVPTATLGSRTNPTATDVPVSAGVQGYLRDGDQPYGGTGTWFLQWNESGDSISGQLSTFKVTQTRPPKYDTSGSAFTGTRTGSKVSLTFAVLSVVLNGTVEGDTLTLLAQDSKTGQLSQYPFKRATAQEFNSAVANAREKAEKSFYALNGSLVGTWTIVDAREYALDAGKMQFTQDNRFILTHVRNSNSTAEGTFAVRDASAQGSKTCGTVDLFMESATTSPWASSRFCVEGDTLTMDNDVISVRAVYKAAVSTRTSGSTGATQPRSTSLAVTTTPILSRAFAATEVAFAPTAAANNKQVEPGLIGTWKAQSTGVSLKVFDDPDPALANQRFVLRALEFGADGYLRFLGTPLPPRSFYLIDNTIVFRMPTRNDSGSEEFTYQLSGNTLKLTNRSNDEQAIYTR